MKKKNEARDKNSIFHKLNEIEPKPAKSNKIRSREFRERKKKERDILAQRVQELETEVDKLKAENVILKSKLQDALQSCHKSETSSNRLLKSQTNSEKIPLQRIQEFKIEEKF